MRSGTRFILSSLPFAALSSVPLASAAGESPYNPVYAACAVPHPAAAAVKACEQERAKSHPAQDFSYFCHAGNKGPSHMLYITPIHHLDGGADGTTENSMDQAWPQAIHGQRDAYLPECQITQTSDVQRQRHDILAQPRAGIVNVQYQYGQNGPAIATH